MGTSSPIQLTGVTVREDINEAMSSTIVNEALTMGFSRKLVKRVVRKQIDEYLCNYQTLEALLDELVITEDNLIDFGSADEGESIPSTAAGPSSLSSAPTIDTTLVERPPSLVEEASHSTSVNETAVPGAS